MPADGRGERSARHVTEQDQFAGLRVDLGVRRHRSLEPSVEAPGADWIERLRIDFERRVPLLQGEQLAAVPDHAGVGQPFLRKRFRLRIVVHRIEGIEETAPLATLKTPFVRAYPAVSIAHAAVLNAEHVQHAVACEPVVFAARGILGIRAVAIVGDVEIGRQFAAHDHIVNVALHANGRVVASELGMVGISCGHGYPPAMTDFRRA